MTFTMICLTLLIIVHFKHKHQKRKIKSENYIGHLSLLDTSHKDNLLFINNEISLYSAVDLLLEQKIITQYEHSELIQRLKENDK